MNENYKKEIFEKEKRLQKLEILMDLMNNKTEDLRDEIKLTKDEANNIKHTMCDIFDLHNRTVEKQLSIEETLEDFIEFQTEKDQKQDEAYRNNLENQQRIEKKLDNLIEETNKRQEEKRINSENRIKLILAIITAIVSIVVALINIL